MARPMSVSTCVRVPHLRCVMAAVYLYARVALSARAKSLQSVVACSLGTWPWGLMSRYSSVRTLQLVVVCGQIPHVPTVIDPVHNATTMCYCGPAMCTHIHTHTHTHGDPERPGGHQSSKPGELAYRATVLLCVCICARV